MCIRDRCWCYSNLQPRRTEGVTMSLVKRNRISPAQIIMIGFLLLILTGALLLMLPISSKSGEITAFPDALFTATSATCVTGLIVFDTYQHWSLFGLSLIHIRCV